MEPLSTVLALGLGLLLRIGLPVAGTLLMAALLRRLDLRWQAEVEQQNAALAYAPDTRCWDIHPCPDEQRLACPAFIHPETPCWQHFRAPNGDLRSSCLACELFRNVGVRQPEPARAVR